MGLFLLGIPIGIAGMYTLGKDTSRTLRDERIETGKRKLSEQKKQIDRYFIDIVKYCNANCKVNSNGIYNVKEGEYGGMELYLFKKGYKKEAIDYCKEKFDEVAKNEKKIKLKQAQKRVKEFENALEVSDGKDVTIVIEGLTSKTQHQVKRDVEKLTKYFNSHYNNVEVNVLMGGLKVHHNHTETWLIKEPVGYNALNYYFDVCDVLDIK